MDARKINLNNLEKYSIFLNFIRDKAELNNNFNFFCLGNEVELSSKKPFNILLNGSKIDSVSCLQAISVKNPYPPSSVRALWVSW